MNRRTFSKSTAVLGGSLLLVPAVALPATHALGLPAAIQSHLSQAKAAMRLGITSRHQASMLNAYLEPVKILKIDQQADGYEVKFRNHCKHTIILTSSKGAKSMQINI